MPGRARLALTALSASLLAACSPVPGDAPGTGGPKPTSPPTSQRAGWWNARPACEVPLPDGVRTQWTPPDHEKVSSMWPLGGMNESGLIPFSQIKGTYRGLTTWNIKTSEVKRLHTFSEIGFSYGAFDGRYIIEKYFPKGLEAWMQFTINIYDTATGDTWEAGVNQPATSHGTIPATPLESLGIRNGSAWWATGIDTQTTEVRVADLARKSVQVVAKGPYTGANFSAGGLILNRLSEGAEGWREFVSLSGEKKPLPTAARVAAKHQWASVGPRGDVAFLDADWTEIHYIAPGEEEPHLIWQRPIQEKAQYLPIMEESGMLLRTMEPNTYYFDMVNGVYTKFLNGVGGVSLGESIVSQFYKASNAPKGAPGPRDFQVLSLPPGSIGPCLSTPAPLTPTTRAPITPTETPPPPGTA